MSPREIQYARLLEGCRMLPGSWEKRFARGMAAASHVVDSPPLSEKQRACLGRLVYLYRRQLRLSDAQAQRVQLELQGMTESEWLTSDDPQRMLNWFNSETDYKPSRHPVASDRKFRLFACAACRQVWDGAEPCPGNRAGPCCQTPLCPVCHGTGRVGGLTDPRSRRAVEVAERYADGLATDQERQATWQEASDAGEDFDRVYDVENFNLAVMAQACVRKGVDETLRANRSCVPPATQAALLRDIFGNPRRSVTCLSGSNCPSSHRNGVCDCKAVLSWNGRTVPKLAAAIYAERAFDRLPILADALEDADCCDVDILAHCRGRCDYPGCLEGWIIRTDGRMGADLCRRCRDPKGNPVVPTHARGCFVLDFLLGKE